MTHFISGLLMIICFCTTSPLFAQEVKNEAETLVLIETSMGKVKVKLFNDTPQHRDNFIKNISEHLYDGTLFHRVIKQFMVQGGDFQSKNAAPGEKLGEDSVTYTIPAEIIYPKYFHKKGMLCAARGGDEDNPERASSPAQFYIVTGKHFTEMELIKMQESSKTTYTPEQMQGYMIEGGAPHLDDKYTVFGEVVSGMNIIDKIQFVMVDDNSRPIKNVTIKKISIIKK